MADSTPQKRVLPARERRESAAKRLATTPTTQPSSTPKSTPIEAEPRQKRKYTKRASLVKAVERNHDSSTPGAAEEILPTKLVPTKPLPTLSETQSDALSNNDYQSYADSAILAASLHRSRMQWLCEGIFKRYWVKPMKRKGVVIEPPGNPDIKTMQKLGNATVTIEPHTFDATFYTVKDPTAPAQAYPKHPNQHTPKQPHQPPLAHGPASVQSTPAAQPNPSPVATPATPTPGHTVKQEYPTQSRPPQPAAAPPGPVPPPRPPVKPSEDPVIQMLAARAAINPRLKDLMKVVAMSEASPEQLREFQSHIDEFNTVVKQRAAKNGESGLTNKSLPASSTTPVPPPTVQPHRPGPAASPSTHMQPPPYLPYHAPPYRPEPIIKHVILEFHSPVSYSQGSTTDRWLFPEHAVLEMKPNGTDMVVSFFAERTGEEILKSADEHDEAFRQKFQTGVNYYEPITMTIKATQHRTIETIARAATTLPEVVKYMQEVMEKQTRAPREYLVYRLPRDRPLQEASASEFIDSGVDVSEAEDDELKDYYGI